MVVRESDAEQLHRASLTECYVGGELIEVCKPDNEVVDITSLLHMTTEERHIRALPVAMQRFMAECVLAGYRFEYYPTPAFGIWRVWRPQGTLMLRDGRADFSGLMFVLDHIGFTYWLADAGRRELQLREIL